MTITFEDTARAGGVLLVDFPHRQIAIMVALVQGPRGTDLLWTIDGSTTWRTRPGQA